MLVVRRSLAALSEWYNLPTRIGFAELDHEIEKFRILRDSYKLLSMMHSQKVLITLRQAQGERTLAL
jgi:hypothetical protein